MTMRDNVQVAKESVEKSVTIEQLKKEIVKLEYNLSIADEIIGNLYDELKLLVEKICLEEIEEQKERESKLGYGLDDYTEGRIVGAAALARRIIREIRS
jgi:hypothetical protein